MGKVSTLALLTLLRNWCKLHIVHSNFGCAEDELNPPEWSGSEIQNVKLQTSNNNYKIWRCGEIVDIFLVAGSDSIKGLILMKIKKKISTRALPRLNELMSEAGGLLKEVESISIRAWPGPRWQSLPIIIANLFLCLTEARLSDCGLCKVLQVSLSSQ